MAFSEAVFLNSHKQGPKIPDENLEGTRKRRKRGKAADTEAEISRYFTSKIPGVCQAPGDAEEKRRQAQTLAYPAREDQHRYGNGETSPELSPPIELPHRPFLGFGSSGPCLSPVKLPYDPSSFQETALPGNHSFPSPTSYYTWSQSSIHSCSLSRRCREGLIPSVDLEAAAPAQKQKRCIERSKDSITSVPPEARDGVERTKDDVGHVKLPLHNDQKQLRDRQCASNTNILERSQPRSNDHVTDRDQPTDGCRTIEELQKNLSKVNTVAKGNQPKPTNVEHGPSAWPSLEPLVDCDTILSFDAALGALLHTFQADPSKRYEPITASEDQELSSRSPANRHLGPDAVRPTRKDGDDVSHTIHEDERRRDKGSNRGSPLQGYSNCSPAPLARSNSQRLYLVGQDAGHRSVASTPAATFVSVESSRKFTGNSARDTPTFYLAPNQQRCEYSGGAWNAYESMYENQKTNEPWHDFLFDEGVRTSYGRAYEPKMQLQSEFHGQGFSSPEDLIEEQFLSHPLGSTEELSDLAKFSAQAYKSPQCPRAFDNDPPTHIEESFPTYQSVADMGFLTHDRVSSVTEKNPLSNFWKPNRLY